MTAYSAIGYGATAATIFAMTRFARMTGGDALVFDCDKTRGSMLTAQIFGSDDNTTGTARWGLYGEFCEAVISRDSFAEQGGIYGKPKAFWFAPSVAYPSLADVYGDTGSGTVTFAHRKKLLSVLKDGSSIISVTVIDLDTSAVETYESGLWMDGSYRGTLARMAGVTMRNVREARSQHSIINAGVNTKYAPSITNTTVRNARGDILAWRQYPGEQEDGMVDRNTQVANVRTQVTNNVSNKIAFSQPTGYAASDFDDWVYWLNTTGQTSATSTLGVAGDIGDPADGKFATNPGDGFGGKASWAMGEATYEEYQEYVRQVQYDQLGRWWTAAFDSRVTSSTLKTNMQAYGLCADEHTGAVVIDGVVSDPYGITPGMPEGVYFRGDMRMIGVRVATEVETWGGDPALLAKADRGTVRYQPPHCISWAGYTNDLHAGRKATLPGGHRTEGAYGDDWSGAGAGSLFGISMDTVLPHPSQVNNLINPMTPSVDRLYWGQNRLEPALASCGDSCGAILAGCFLLDIPPGYVLYNQVVPYLTIAGAPMSYADVQHLPS